MTFYVSREVNEFDRRSHASVTRSVTLKENLNQVVITEESNRNWLSFDTWYRIFALASSNE